MTQQPEALRLADDLADELDVVYYQLRRLQDRITELEAALQQTLEALEMISEAMPFPVGRQAITTAKQALEGKA